MTQTQIFDLVKASVVAQIRATGANFHEFSWLGRNHKKPASNEQSARKAA